MSFMVDDGETICAVSTPPGEGGIAVIRVCGSKACEVFKPLARQLTYPLDSHRLYHTFLTHDLDNSVLDEVVVSFFAQGRSFTGEETIEISCHGGRLVSQMIMNRLQHLGARPARPGEFTYRAFLNGRLDLVQAESILELIKGQSAASVQRAAKNLKGALSLKYGGLEKDLLWTLAHIEASIDFSTEDIELIADSKLVERLTSVSSAVDSLIESYGYGKVLTNGIEIVLMGEPNAGKSSLLNRLVGEDRAIVTDIAGTTRDLVQGEVVSKGVTLKYVDTAGLRPTDNEIEKIGIQKSLHAASQGDLIFWIQDIESLLISDALKSLIVQQTGKVWMILNKIDKLAPSERELKLKIWMSLAGEVGLSKVLPVSAQTGENVDDLENKIRFSVETTFDFEDVVVTQARHFHILEKISAGVKRAAELVDKETSPEFVAFELHQCLNSMYELLGRDPHERVIDQIFKEFCLGK